jgi:multicomponent Na+:H+ antiporter subunit F
MNTLAMVLLAVLLLPLAITVARMLGGPGMADRFVALDMLTGIAVAAGALTAVLTGRREFLDVGLGLAVFGFVGTIALAAFLARKGKAHS